MQAEPVIAGESFRFAGQSFGKHCRHVASGQPANFLHHHEHGRDPIHAMGFSPHGEAARAGAKFGLGTRSIRRETVFHKHAFGRSPITNQTKAENMKTVNKKNPMGAVIVIAIALAAWLPTTAGEL